MTSLADIRTNSLPTYCELLKAIRKHLEERNIAGLELCDKLWNGKNWLPKEPDNLTSTLIFNDQESLAFQLHGAQINNLLQMIPELV